MDPVSSTLAIEMVKAVGEGNLVKFGAYLAIFFVIWIEVRGLKREVANLSKTIGHSFEEGEKRFDRIEDTVSNLEARMKAFEKTNTSQGGINGLDHKGIVT
jgi:hypothetical protein